MKLLSIEEADKLICKAWQDVHKYGLGQYRFGQSLSNLLPNCINEHLLYTENDFYYCIDSDKVTELFYKHCVESTEG